MEKPVPCTKAMVQLESVWGYNKGGKKKKKEFFLAAAFLFPICYSALPRSRSPGLVSPLHATMDTENTRAQGMEREREEETGKGPFSLAFDRSAGFHTASCIRVCAPLLLRGQNRSAMKTPPRLHTLLFSRILSLSLSPRFFRAQYSYRRGGLSPPW